MTTIRRPLARSYTEIAAAQGLTKAGHVNRTGLSRAERAVLDVGPRSRREATVEEQIVRNEKYVISLLRPTAEINNREIERDRVKLAVVHNTADQLELAGADRDYFVASYGTDSGTIRAAKAGGHLLTAVNLKASVGVPETPYEMMERLGLTEQERERLGEFTVTITWARA